MEDLAHMEMWRGVEAFGNTEVSREELLASFQRILEKFPGSPHIPRARATAEMLATMIREDREHAATRNCRQLWANGDWTHTFELSTAGLSTSSGTLFPAGLV